MKTALIIGSTGLIGSIIRNLLESADYDKVIFLKRDTTHKLTQHIIDFDKPESYQNLVVGDFFSAPLYDYQKCRK
jgi:NAD dependent epimerase/dehydratase family enzyme